MSNIPPGNSGEGNVQKTRGKSVLPQALATSAGILLTATKRLKITEFRINNQHSSALVVTIHKGATGFTVGAGNVLTKQSIASNTDINLVPSNGCMYLEAGQQIKGLAGTADLCNVTISYEEEV